MKYIIVILLIVTSAGTADCQMGSTSSSRNNGVGRVVDKNFIVAHTSWAAATAFDTYTTQVFLGRGRCAEMNPIVGSNPTTERLVKIDIALLGGLTFVDYLLKKHNHKLWLVAPVVGTATHTFAGTYNIKHCF